MPDTNSDATVVDPTLTDVEQQANTAAVPLTKAPTAPLDQKLDQLEQLASELRDLDDASALEPSAWPVGFCLSIIVPVYNEVDTIELMLQKLLDLEIPKQIIVIDDGSVDGTQEVLSQWLGRDDVDVVLKRHNEGKGAALRTGFAHVDGGLVIVQDADLEYDPNEIPSLVRPILNGEADVVYGSRFMEQRWKGSSFVHRFGNRLLTEVSNATTGLRLTDMETCYKVFPADLLNQLEVRQDRFGFEPEITAKLARRELQFVEIPVSYDARDWSEGKKIGVGDAISALYCIIRYAWFD